MQQIAADLSPNFLYGNQLSSSDLICSPNSLCSSDHFLELKIPVNIPSKMLFKLTLCIIVAAAILPSGFTQEVRPVHVHLSASDLPPSDPLNGSPDAYVITSYAFGDSQFAAIGTTSVINDQVNPTWPQVYNFGVLPGNSQRLRFEIWDEDLDSDADDYIGDVQIYLSDLNLAPNRTLTMPIEPAGNGHLIIKGNLPSTAFTTPQHAKNSA